MRQILYTLVFVLLCANYSFSENIKNSSIKDKDLCENGTCSYIKQDLGDGLIIEGQFNYNWDGKGTLKLNSKGVNSTYSGYFKQMKPHGEGIFTWTNGNMYNGQWIEGKKNGFGMFKDKYGLYAGNWKDDMRNGDGKIFLNNGKTFEGKFLNNKKEGEGTWYYTNGDKFVGKFKDGLKNGYGIDFLSEGHEIRGNHVNNLRVGKTEVHLNDGAIVQWVYDKGNTIDGEGYIKTSNGKLFKGYWKNGELKVERKNNKNLELLLAVLYALGETYNNNNFNNQNNSLTGITKVCYYDGIGGPSALTVPSSSICPLNHKKMSGFTKICEYPNSIGGPKALTVPSTSICPVSYPR